MITAFVKGQALTVQTPVVAADTLNYLTARFVFGTSDWDGVIKFAHFSDGTHAAHVELTDDAIPASAGLNLTAGKWTVSVTGHAYDGGGELIKRITTETAVITVADSGVTDGEPLPVSPSAAEEILGRVVDLENALGVVKNVRDGGYLNIWAGTEEQYAAAEKSADTIYLVGLTGGDGD